MKALPPPPSQLQLWTANNRQLIVVENSERQRVLRALAEILLVAADVAVPAESEDVDETP